MTNELTETRRRTSVKRLAAFAALALLSLGLPGAASAQWTAPDAQGNVTSTNAGNVGIGAAPENPEGWAKVLEIFGQPHARFSIRSATIDSRVMSHEGGWWGAPAGMFVGTRTNHPLTFGTGNTFRMTIGVGGNVGIGTAAPVERLDVRGNLVLEPSTSPTLYTGTGAAELNRYLNIINSPTLTSASGLKAGGILVSDDYGFANPAKNDLIVKGRIGIGTAGAAAYKLDVAGPIRSTAGGFVFPDGTTQNTAASGTPSAANIAPGQFGLNAGGGNYSFPANIGIGTATPENSEGWNKVLDMLGTQHAKVSLRTSAIDARVLAHDVGWWGAPAGMVVGTRTNHPLSLGTAGASRVTIESGGNVGIGTTAPAAKLHVAGDVRIDGNISAKYQDVAEWVPSTQKLNAGTVVVLDTGRGNHVLASAGAYDTRVAGVVSAQPGIALGERGEGKVLVATTGRVKVKVDATRTPIQIGDLIVTSDVEGVAMKSEPIQFGGRQIHAPGTIIGKALEPLEKGMGEILVLLSLQ